MKNLVGAVGEDVGVDVGEVGPTVGAADGAAVGAVGVTVGVADGAATGAAVGIDVGTAVGAAENTTIESMLMSPRCAVLPLLRTPTKRTCTAPGNSATCCTVNAAAADECLSPETLHCVVHTMALSHDCTLSRPVPLPYMWYANSTA